MNYDPKLPEDFYENRKLYWLYATRQSLLDIGVHPLGICTEINEINAGDASLTQAALTESEAHSLIPKNTLYCYGRNGTANYRQCPFWDKIEHFPKMSNGFCHFLKEGDFTHNSSSLLWDSCKSCGISDDIEFETYE